MIPYDQPSISSQCSTLICLEALDISVRFSILPSIRGCPGLLSTATINTTTKRVRRRNDLFGLYFHITVHY